MKVFIDTEFHEFKKKPFFGKAIDTIELISIGIIGENGTEYYAISKDFDVKAAWNNEWLRENVLIDIHYELSIQEANHKLKFDKWKKIITSKDGYSKRHFKTLKKLISKYGKSNKQIAEEVKEFCKPNRKYEIEQPITIKYSEIQNPEFYGYYSDYDWVVFCWLFGRMIDLPRGFPMYCIDLKQELNRKADTFKRNDFFTAADFKDEKLPELTLEEKVKHLKMHVRYPEQTNNHNALSDAKWNHELYKFLQSL